MVKVLVETVMGAEADVLCRAGNGERNTERVNRRNGYRSRPWDTRASSISLAVPKLREGPYLPDWLLEPRRRTERSFVSVVAERYVKGVTGPQTRLLLGRPVWDQRWESLDVRGRDSHHYCRERSSDPHLCRLLEQTAQKTWEVLLGISRGVDVSENRSARTKLGCH